MVEEIQRLTFVDSSVLIEYFRKSKKENSFFFKLLKKGFEGFAASVVVHFEIYKGINNKQISYWDNVFEDMIVVPYTHKINKESINIYHPLKRIKNLLNLKI